jgi:hypothetical protein
MAHETSLDPDPVSLDVGPLEPEGFCGPHPCRRQQLPEGVPAVLTRGLEKAPELLDAQYAQFTPLHARQVHVLRRVSGQESPFHGLLEGRAEDGVSVSDGPGREVALGHSIIDPLDLSRRQLGQRPIPQGRDDVEAPSPHRAWLRFGRALDPPAGCA